MTVIKVDKMEIWNAVAKTDPSHTKKVNQRGGFTAISAHYQVMRATEQFGPVGIGWGYENGAPIFHDGLVFVPVTIWHGKRDNSFGPLYGGAEWRTKHGVDSDALKKAATDGLTKALSHLGFNADVFLGMFDDNKYVAEVTKEFSGAGGDTGQGQKGKVSQIVPVIDEAQYAVLTTLVEQSGADMKKLCAYYRVPSLNELPAAQFDTVSAQLKSKLKKAA